MQLKYKRYVGTRIADSTAKEEHFCFDFVCYDDSNNQSHMMGVDGSIETHPIVVLEDGKLTIVQRYFGNHSHDNLQKMPKKFVGRAVDEGFEGDYFTVDEKKRAGTFKILPCEKKPGSNDLEDRCKDCLVANAQKK